MWLADSSAQSWATWLNTAQECPHGQPHGKGLDYFWRNWQHQITITTPQKPTTAPVLLRLRHWQCRQVYIFSSYCFLWPLCAGRTGKEHRRWLRGWKAQAGAGTQGPGHRHTTPSPPPWETCFLLALICLRQSLRLCGLNEVSDTTKGPKSLSKCQPS